MSRVITFSRYFPATHPKKGQPTFFVEQIYNSANYDCGDFSAMREIIGELNNSPSCKETILLDFIHSLQWGTIGIKSHTIRAGNRWKVGDKFSPRVWSGKPYQSKQIIIAPDIEIKKIWDIRIEGFWIWINKQTFSHACHTDNALSLAKNDGLAIDDFWNWFPCKPGKIFTGQTICWNDSIEY